MLLVVPIVASVSVLGSLASIYGWFKPGLSTPAVAATAGPLTGDLNFAVAPFTTTGGNAQDGVLLAQSTYLVLKRKLGAIDSALVIDTRGPLQIAAAPLTPQSARQLASRLNADFVLYGTLHEGQLGTTLTPHFYVNPAKLPGAGELGGDYDYAAPIHASFSPAANPQTRADIRAKLLQQTDAFADILVGLGYYLTRKLPDATRFFEQSARLSPQGPARALSLLFLGNISAQEGNAKEAIARYKQASGYPAMRARSDFGIAEASYTQARGSCTSGSVDSRGLYEARSAFASVPTSSDAGIPFGDPASLRAKVFFGLGQVDLCLSAAGTSRRWGQARSEFDEVITIYTPRRPQLRNDAAEAHGGLGLINLLNSPPNFTSAADEYLRAAQLTTISTRQAFFRGMAKYAQAQLRRASANSST